MIDSVGGLNKVNNLLATLNVSQISNKNLKVRVNMINVLCEYNPTWFVIL